MRPELTFSDFVDPVDFDELTGLCLGRLTVADGIPVLSHFTCGVHDFTIDFFGKSADAAERRRQHELMGRQLNFSGGRMEERLHDLGNGDLIRSVFGTTSGAAFRHRTRVDEHLIAVATDPALVEAADRKLSDLATEIRGRYALGPENPGGYRSAAPTVLPAGEIKPVDRATEEFAPDHEELIERCRRALDLAGLHYVAHSHEGRFGFSTDILDHAVLRGWTRVVGPEVKRAHYEEALRWLPSTTRRLERQLAPILGGRLDRIVLDVHEGAVFYRQMEPGEFLMGVTLDQRRVAEAQTTLDRLAATESDPRR